MEINDVKRDNLDEDAPLPKIKCTSVDCNNNLHCFRPKRAKIADIVGGKCHECDADLVEWNRVHKRNISDVQATFSFLKKEFIRHHFWNIELSRELKDKLFYKGRNFVQQEIAKRIKKSVGCEGNKIFRDGIQTPTKKSNIIFYAQHATATCCRKCIKYWHDIPYDRDLTEDELQYLSQLVIMYIDDRIPELPKDGAQLKIF